VEERHAWTTTADWLSPEADAAVKTYLADRRAEPKLSGALSKAWTVRQGLVEASQSRNKLDSERNILQDAAEQARASLRAISRNRGGSVDELRKKLTERLTELEKRLAETANKLVEQDLKANELRVRFDEAVRDLKLAEPLPPQAA
jgi:DNA anti-recombination protein RmuC